MFNIRKKNEVTYTDTGIDRLKSRSMLQTDASSLTAVESIYVNISHYNQTNYLLRRKPNPNTIQLKENVSVPLEQE